MPDQFQTQQQPQQQPQQQLSPAVVQAFQQINAQNKAQNQQQPSKANAVLKLLMMLAQGADSMNTADFLKKPGTYETDPLMRPFAQAGNPLGMMGAYGLEDQGINSLPSAGMQNNASILQLLLNLAGIARTQHARKSGH